LKLKRLWWRSKWHSSFFSGTIGLPELFNNFNNLGYKNGVLTYFDVGGYFVSEPVFDSSDIILIPENFHNIGENYSIDIANSIVKQIASKLGVKNKTNWKWYVWSCI